MGRKKGILVVGIGVGRLDMLERTVGATMQAVEERFPEYRVYRAFTSKVMIQKLRLTENLAVDTVGEALERMRSDGIETVLVQPMHVVNGIENDSMLECLMEHADRFRQMRVGRPLLSSPDDYKKAVHAVMEEVHLAADEALVLVGHGTRHYANAAYPTLEYMFHLLGHRQVLVGTVEGFPSLSDVKGKLAMLDCRKVRLMPFMMVAGGHVKRDMAGGEGSWKCGLEEAGYEVDVLVKGLGELEGIRGIFLEHLEEIR